MKTLRIAGIFLVLSLLLSVVSYAKTEQSFTYFDNSKIVSGSVGARYTPIEEKRIKTRVQKAEDKYDYDLFGRDKYEYFPLQLGQGDYKISIFENVTDNRYRQVKAQNIKAEIKDPLDVFRGSVQTVSWDSEMSIIEKASELTENLKTDKAKITAIYNFVLNTFSYDYDKINTIDTTYVPDIEKVYKDQMGICYDYAAVFAAMLRSQNIPAKLMKGYSDLVKEYHAWNEVYLAHEDRWIVIDTTYDSVRKKSNKKYTMEKDSKKYKAIREF